MSEHRHTVGLSGQGTRLDTFLAALHPELSRSRVKALIESGHVRLSRGGAKPSRVLRAGDVVHLLVPPPVPATPAAENIPLEVLYEDADVIVVNKRPGMTVHPGAGASAGTLVNALLHHCADLAGIGGELRPGIVHRLDKDTSGCLVAAKTEAALRTLQRAFKGRQVEKTYLAVVHGVPDAQGVFETLHGRHPRDRKRFTSKVRTGRTAVTRWRLREAFCDAAFVEAEPLTGRTHQIRVHFAEAGHPLLGDAAYGGGKREARPKGSPAARAAEAIGRHALHAWRLAFAHPRTGRLMRLEAPIPRDFESGLALLRQPPSLAPPVARTRFP